jgi:Flp pilus assembly protein TadD
MIERSSSTWTISSNRKWRFHLWRGAQSLEAGDFHGAQRYFAAAYREAPDEPLVCLAWGRERLRAGDAEAAERLLRRAWEADPSLITAGLQLARVLGLHLDRRWEASALLDRLEGREGASAALLLLRAELALREPTEFEVAKADLERAEALGAEPSLVKIGLARAFNAEGVVRSRQGEHHRALFALKRATDLDPQWSAPLVNRGTIFDRLGQPVKAQRLYRQALQLEPRNPVALFNLADSLRRHGGAAEAERLYRKLLDLQPGYPGGEAGLRKLLERRSSDAERPR